MTATHRPAAGGAAVRHGTITRFDLVERTTHWLVAALFAVLAVTGLALYVPAAGALVGRRNVVADIHVWSGVALPVALLLAMAGPWGRQLRRDMRRIDMWTPGEMRWLRTLGHRGGPVTDKFNPGQKLNAIFVGSIVGIMLVTGMVMRWFAVFPLGWRTGATFLHDVFALAIVVVVVGHVLFAVTHRDAMRSMVLGWVTEDWARRHAPGWLAEMRAGGRPDQTRPHEPGGHCGD